MTACNNFFIAEPANPLSSYLMTEYEQFSTNQEVAFNQI